MQHDFTCYKVHDDVGLNGGPRMNDEHYMIGITIFRVLIQEQVEPSVKSTYVH